MSVRYTECFLGYALPLYLSTVEFLKLLEESEESDESVLSSEKSFFAAWR